VGSGNMTVFLAGGATTTKDTLQGLQAVLVMTPAIIPQYIICMEMVFRKLSVGTIYVK